MDIFKEYPERIAKKIAGITQVPWVKEDHHDLQKCRIKTEAIENGMLRKEIVEANDLSEEKLMRTTRIVSEKEEEKVSERMKQYWGKSKELEKILKK